ncbi:hypothetical protein AYI70_g7583 [Smittium culicis]|uniref:Uncharacterized protein n=1 Tax=Smittium culicis TaxID=133412 RepID=A0A1R1XJY1_9FUNG|nr:hypothetical protein AYI70_g7583 [Smittium culicis]
MINGLYKSKNELISNNGEIRKMVYSFYESLFKKGTTEDKCQYELISNITNKLNASDQKGIDKDIELSEITNVIDDSPNNKAPVPTD